ncbi:MAG: N-6 DNA methylase [Betaproteobacteria bacterium]|nr:N-6 DNA methylase [Betaproteobacteria bacterium]
MPFTADMRRAVEQIRDYLYGGGYPDPVNNAEQLSFLFFFYLAEGLDVQQAARARIAKKARQSVFAGDWKLKNPLNAQSFGGKKTIPRENLRWSVWANGLSGEALVRFVRDEVFPFFAEMANGSAVNFMDGARLSIDEPTVLTQVVNLVNGLHLDQADADSKGDLFEHVLKQIRQAGELGQFRTPRHIIRTIVEIVDPKIGETIYDPAAGTAGFLVAAYNHIRLANSSPDGIEEVELDGKKVRRGLGDRLSAAQQTILESRTFFGNDVDPKMVHLATMNLTLRGLPGVRIVKRNVLTTPLEPEAKQALGIPAEGYSVVLANPPFSGRLDKDRILDDIKVGTTTATEILFVKYMLESLKPGGRCGVVVPDGLLFGPSGAHKELRRQLLENNTLEAVMSLPGGVFQPYSNSKTSVLFFHKSGSTARVLFLHADADGYKLDAQHDTPIDDDDLATLIDIYRNREKLAKKWEKRDSKAEWKDKWWFASADEVRARDFNLSVGTYRPFIKTRVEHRDPRELLDELSAIETEIAKEIDSLRDSFSRT